jgi:hypothetical protein
MACITSGVHGTILSAVIVVSPLIQKVAAVPSVSLHVSIMSAEMTLKQSLFSPPIGS